MITESKVKQFQQINKQSDIMGVVRTLNSDVKITISKKTKK